jgi:sporadic carbohydrate cluster protein (TIGR04323 family)
MSERRGFRGYVTSRGFGGYSIPVPVQSLVLRDYCQRNNMLYVLPVNENIFPHSYMVLEGMIRDLSAYEGMICCSMHMLPQRPERRRKIYDSILSQGAALHLVLEGAVIARPADIEKVEDLLVMMSLSAQGTGLAAAVEPGRAE